MSENFTPVSRARQLRKNMTPEEKVLWQKLRNRNFHGLKFLRQHPLIYEEINGKPLFFVPDFYCSEKKIVIEIDGKIHEFQKEYDERRAEILTKWV
jgi:leucyl-tRNA synthetase